MANSMYHRRSIRLKGYDYSSPGSYFVTLVTKDRRNLFGKLNNGQMYLNPIGNCAAGVLMTLPKHFNVKIDSWIIMPDHLHCILEISSTGEASKEMRNLRGFDACLNASPPRPIGTSHGSLGAIIQNYKSISTRRINSMLHTPGNHIWQRNYYEHIIRDERDRQAIAEYIVNNPRNWAADRENLARLDQ